MPQGKLKKDELRKLITTQEDLNKYLIKAKEMLTKIQNSKYKIAGVGVDKINEKFLTLENFEKLLDDKDLVPDKFLDMIENSSATSGGRKQKGGEGLHPCLIFMLLLLCLFSCLMPPSTNSPAYELQTFEQIFEEDKPFGETNIYYWICGLCFVFMFLGGRPPSGGSSKRRKSKKNKSRRKKKRTRRRRR